MRIPARRVRRSGWIDLSRTRRRAGRLLSITHIGTYRVVLTQPHDRRTGVVLNLRYVMTVTRASMRIPARRVFGEVVRSISRAQNVERAGS